jgi:hypothetical protein
LLGFANEYGRLGTYHRILLEYGEPPEYSEQAVAALKAAVAEKDYKASFVLETDPDLAAVRAEPAFKVLVDEVKGR